MTDIGVTRARNETMLIGCKGRKNTQAARDWDTSLDNRSILQFSSTTFNANFKRNKKCTVIINDTSLSIITDGGCDDCSAGNITNFRSASTRDETTTRDHPPAIHRQASSLLGNSSCSYLSGSGNNWSHHHKLCYCSLK